MCVPHAVAAILAQKQQAVRTGASWPESAAVAGPEREREPEPQPVPGHGVRTR